MKKTLIFLIIFSFFQCKKDSINPPLAPSNLKSEIISTTKSSLTWTDNSTNEDGFKIERKSTNGIYNEIGSVGLNISSFTDSSLSPGSTYVYRVLSYNKGGKSLTYSNEVSLTTYNIPTLSTINTTSITALTAVSGGEKLNDNGSRIIARGVCWSSNPNPTIKDSIASSIIGSDYTSFKSSIKNLSPNTKYYVRAFATNNAGTGYGDVETFVTFAQSVPIGLTTKSITGIYYYSANSGGTSIMSDGYANITQKGIVWSTNSLPTISLTSKTNDGTGSEQYNSFLGDLKPNTTYYVRAYATNSIGTIYGNELVFKTKETSTPILASGTLKNITTNSALFSDCSVSDDGGYPILARGSCWSTSSNPTILNNKTNDGTSLTYYSSQIINLNPNTTYYIRAYATNSLGTSYGIEKTFTTLQ
jgi:hypothetical protein